MAHGNEWRQCGEPSLDPPEDPPECPECDGPLKVIKGDRMDCPACGWNIEWE